MYIAHNRSGGIKIEKYSMMKKYFNYEQVRGLLLKKDANYCEENADDVLVILKSKDCAVNSSPLLTVIENAADPFGCKELINIFPTDEASDIISTELRSVDYSNLQNYLEAMWSEPYFVCDPVCEKLTDKMAYTKEQAYELLLFCSLFAFLQKEPENGDVELLKGYLEQLSPDTAKYHQSDRSVIDIVTPTAELQGFSGCSDGRNIKLSLTVIRNKLDTTVTVTVENSPLRRRLAAHSELLALTANGETVTFLPRFCVAQDYLYRQKESSLIAADSAGHTFSLPLAVEGPVFFSESKKYGILAADKDGRFLSVPFHGKKPDDTVCWLKGDLQDYGFLTQQGTYEGACTRESWKDLLFFDLGGGDGLAVTADRRAIDSSGNIVGENVADVSCCGNRFILLHTDGSVTTDCGPLQVPGLYARAVCAERNGYWVATDEALYHVGQTVTKHKPVPDELARSNINAAVYGLYSDGEIKPLV